MQEGIKTKQSLQPWAREHPRPRINDLHKTWHCRGQREEPKGREAAMLSWFYCSKLLMEKQLLESSLNLTKA